MRANNKLCFFIRAENSLQDRLLGNKTDVLLNPSNPAVIIKTFRGWEGFLSAVGAICAAAM